MSDTTNDIMPVPESGTPVDPSATARDASRLFELSSTEQFAPRAAAAQRTGRVKFHLIERILQAAGHPHAIEIARLFDPRPHSCAGWRQRYFEEYECERFSDLEARLASDPDGEEMTLDDSKFLRDRDSWSPEELVIVREESEALIDPLKRLPGMTCAILAAAGEARSKKKEAALSFVAAVRQLGVPRSTAYRHCKAGLARLASLGIEADDAFRRAQYLAATIALAEGDENVKHHLASITRPMTAEEAEDHRLGYPRNAMARRRLRPSRRVAANEPQANARAAPVGRSVAGPGRSA